MEQIPDNIEKNIIKIVTVTIKLSNVDKVGVTTSVIKIFCTSCGRKPIKKEQIIAKTIAIVSEPPGILIGLRSRVELQIISL